VFNGQFTATAGSREPSIQHGYPSHALRATAFGLSIRPHKNDATPPSRHLLKKARCRASGSAPIIPSRSPSWSTTGRAMDLRSIRVTLFSQHGPSAVRVPSVRSFHRRDVPPGVRNTSSVPLRHSRTLRPLRRIYSECRVQWPVHGNSQRAVNRPFNTATHHTRRKPAQRRYALSRPVLLKATGRARAPLNRCRAEARPDGVTNACPTSRLHGSGHPARPGRWPGRFGPRAGP
jgi:hypothetical protein